MEQRDYLLREIEKIGLLLKMILSKIVRNEENYAITIDRRFEESKELLINEVGFDLDNFIFLQDSEIEQYLSQFNGFNDANLEYLADVLKEIGMSSNSSFAINYMNKALRLYELCNSLDKTYSFDRESKISELKNTLQSS